MKASPVPATTATPTTTGVPDAVNRLERTAGTRLKGILTRVAAALGGKKISPACGQALTQRIAPLREEILGLRTGR